MQLKKTEEENQLFVFSSGEMHTCRLRVSALNIWGLQFCCPLFYTSGFLPQRET